MTDKALAAIIRHEKAAQAVKALGPRISEALSGCPNEKKYSDETLHPDYRDLFWCDNTQRVKTHLWHAFQFREQSSCGYRSVGLDDDGVLEALSEGGEYECEHCRAAYLLVLERKEMRRELGKAKLSIRALGRAALAKAEVNYD